MAFGDSLTEGNLSQLDANNRWPDQLARRLVARPGGRQLGVVNQGTGGGRLLHDGRGDSGLRRFDRDVLAQLGVTHVIAALGVNDLRNSQGRAEEIVTADDLIEGLRQLAVRARRRRAHSLRRDGDDVGGRDVQRRPLPPEGEAKRQALTLDPRQRRLRRRDRLRSGAARPCSSRPGMLPRWDSGDHLHPNDIGYRHMADSVDLALFG